MANLCSSILPVGAVECNKLLGKVEYIIIDQSSVDFDIDGNEIASLSANQLPINTSLTSHFIKVNGYENTTDDPTITTLPNTRKIVSNEPIQSMTMNADFSFCDSQNLLKNLNGANYRVRFITSDNEMLFFRDIVSQKDKGFNASIKAITKGVPTEADPKSLVNIYVNFADYEEFVNSAVVVPEWKASLSLKNAVPVGLNMIPLGSYTNTGGSIDVLVSERCKDVFTGLLTADFVALRSNGLDTVAITAAEDGNGQYTLDITKDVVPVNLEVGDHVVIQVQKKTATVVDYVSNEIVINVTE